MNKPYKLTREERDTMKQWIEWGVSQKHIALAFGVSQPHVSQTRKRMMLKKNFQLSLDIK